MKAWADSVSLVMIDERLSLIGPPDDLRVHRDSAEEGHAHLLGHGLPAAAFEDLDHFLAVRADKPAHVFDHPQNGNLELTAEIDGLSHVLKGEILGRRDDHGAVAVGDELRHRKGLIARSRGKVDHQIVQLAPLHIRQKLLDDAHLHRAPPDDRLVRMAEGKSEGNDLDPIGALHGEHPASVRRFEKLPVQVQERRNAGAVKIDVQKPRLPAFHGQGHGEIHGDGAFPHAAFSRQNQDLVFDPGQATDKRLILREHLEFVIGCLSTDRFATALLFATVHLSLPTSTVVL